MDLSKIINEEIKSSHKEQKRNYIGASSIGSACNRAIWYKYNCYEESGYSSSSITAFDVGKRLESMIIGYLQLAGVEVITPNEFNHHLLCKDDEVESFQGHMDGVIVIDGEPCVLEIKTAKNARFQVFKNKGLKEWSSNYYAQLMSYMGMKGYKRGVILALNKDSSEFHHEWIEFDSYYYNELRQKAHVIQEAKEPPDRINKSPMFLTCSRCSYKEVCFSDKKEGCYE